jgi:hypothetical protein
MNVVQVSVDPDHLDENVAHHGHHHHETGSDEGDRGDEPNQPSRELLKLATLNDNVASSSSPQSSTYRGRLAPSPTGYLHIGHARTFFAAHQRADRRSGTP